MGLKLKLTILAIIVSLTCYSQYPATRTINNDSVVIITTEQARMINQTYLKANDSLAKLKDQTNKLLIESMYLVENKDYTYRKMLSYREMLDDKDVQIRKLKLQLQITEEKTFVRDLYKMVVFFGAAFVLYKLTTN